MNINAEWWLAGLSLLVLVFAWSGLWFRSSAKKTRTIPTHWPLHARGLVNKEELRIWRWLTETFDDHHVMIKMPVTRFTRPNASENGRHLYDLLKNTNCTFSICASDGHVLGCVDVPKSFGLSQKTRNLKENLLEQCGISYIVLNPGRLPTPADIRDEILGEVAARARHLKREEAAIEAARVNLKRTLVQQRRMREFRSVYEKGDSVMSSDMPSQWQDAFLIQANSLPAELRSADGCRLA
ncbi:DUF2726 domain-containing protein [Polaromonas sp. SM01]|uniref:DUF2726 domain-containing protein n=1 Tax=Polaromonas sp. SM01 TaxID=3085630 RepID=UPI0029829C25|nr:hypothetical protein [Polaromonas sp. SM01]MDW5444545.1 hypothetical protein [Polaromonas sp. SM01]